MLFIVLWGILNPCFSQRRSAYAFVGGGIGSIKKTPSASALGGRFSFGVQKEWNARELRIESLLRFAQYRSSKSSKNPNGKVNLYAIDFNLQHDFIRVGPTALIVGAGLGYQKYRGQSGIEIPENDTSDLKDGFANNGIEMNAFFGLRFHPIKTPIGMEIILYEMNYAFQPKTHEIGTVNLRLIYTL